MRQLIFKLSVCSRKGISRYLYYLEEVHPWALHSNIEGQGRCKRSLVIFHAHKIVLDTRIMWCSNVSTSFRAQVAGLGYFLSEASSKVFDFEGKHLAILYMKLLTCTVPKTTSLLLALVWRISEY
jgi:hypothetical protein